MGHRERHGEYQFLVKWTGFDDSENLWLTEFELQDSAQVLSDYRRYSGI